jgi:dUTP pyrophosphatase
MRLEDAAVRLVLRVRELRQYQRLLIGTKGVALTELFFRRLDPDAELPSTQHPGDAGLDLRAIHDAVIEPGERAMIRTGLAVAIPQGHAGLVLPRSGLASKKGLTLANAPGLIDAGYRGEIVCAVVNLDRQEPVKIVKGERIAQLVIVSLPEMSATWVVALPASERGEAGFGSTGTA